jgi:Metallo-peptidase family M12B Reprolysin-like/Calx-beta domain
MKARGTISIIGSLVFGALGASAEASIWQAVPEASAGRPAPGRVLPAGRYAVFHLDRAALSAALDAAPMEFSPAAQAAPALLSIPMPDGSLAPFRVEASPILAPELQAQFPELRAFRGQGIADRTASLRFDLTPHGFHAIILSAAGTVILDPWGLDDSEHVVSYFKRDYRRSDGESFRCLVGQLGLPDARSGDVDALPNGATLRQYRLALAGTGEYTTAVCAPNPPAVGCGLAEMMTAMNRVNGVYERDLAVRMNLVANNNLIVYTDGATDPYTNNNGVTMLGQNQANLDAVIGTANYDIGHVFSTGGGGVAGLGVVCLAGSKARGVTGLPSPLGDPFYIDYVAHEMGHQFGGNHPFNGTTGACGGGNRNAATAWEPGSGSTIMGYAGICGAEDIQPHSDDYFHVGNLIEMTNFIQGAGGTCAAGSATGNTPPTISAGSDISIPAQTPFTLTASASDPDPDTLTYDWEELDLGAAGPPNTDNGNRPIFRSFNPALGPSRTFPQLQYILSADNTPPLVPVSESLPTTTRAMSFRATARDNGSGGGGVNSDLMIVNVTSTAGPFKVTQPDSAVIWTGNNSETVSWNVANTSAAPVSCAAVNILLSSDGGNSFPTSLASGTPNDGSQVVTAPNSPTTTARVRVECASSPFFDISNTNFTIVGGAASVLSVADAAPVLEGNSGNTLAGFQISLTPASGSTVTVTANTADGSATLADNDYLQILNQTVTFNPGETVRTVSVSVVGDTQIEPNENFSLVLSSPSGATIGDDTGIGTIINDDFAGASSPGELNHDSRETTDLSAQGGVPRPRLWRMNQGAYRSYEVIVDGITGDVAAGGLQLTRLDTDGVTVLQSVLLAPGGAALSMRFQNPTGGAIGGQFIRAGSGGCTTCDSSDTIRVRAYETTYLSPRFNNSATQVTLLVLANTTDQPVTGTASFFQGSTGAHLADVPFALGPRATFVTNTSVVAGLAGQAGSIRITNDAPFGALAGKAVAVEPATGFTFDTPIVPRTAATKMVPRDN